MQQQDGTTLSPNEPNPAPCHILSTLAVSRTRTTANRHPTNPPHSGFELPSPLLSFLLSIVSLPHPLLAVQMIVRSPCPSHIIHCCMCMWTTNPSGQTPPRVAVKKTPSPVSWLPLGGVDLRAPPREGNFGKYSIPLPCRHIPYRVLTHQESSPRALGRNKAPSCRYACIRQSTKKTKTKSKRGRGPQAWTKAYNIGATCIKQRNHSFGPTQLHCSLAKELLQTPRDEQGTS